MKESEVQRFSVMSTKQGGNAASLRPGAPSLRMATPPRQTRTTPLRQGAPPLGPGAPCRGSGSPSIDPGAPRPRPGVPPPEEMAAWTVEEVAAYLNQVRGVYAFQYDYLPFDMLLLTPNVSRCYNIC
jgi:hypothetical protein